MNASKSYGGQRVLHIRVVGNILEHLPSARHEKLIVLRVTLLKTLVLEFLVSLEIEPREPDVVCNAGQDAWHVDEQV